MRKHVIQFEIEVPSRESEQDIITNIKALLDLLNYKASKLKLDPPPEIKIIPDSQPYPYDTPKRPDQDPYPWEGPWKKKTADPYWRYGNNDLVPL